MFYRIVIIFLVLIGAYVLYGVGHFKWMYHAVAHPSAEYQISGAPDGDTSIILFTNYTCGFCKGFNTLIKDVAAVRKDIRIVDRPVIYGEVDSLSIVLVKIVFAAGMQGKFREFHDAFMEYPEPIIPDSFIEETAMLYGVDYDRLVKDADSKDVQRLVDENLKAFNHAGANVIPTIMINKTLYTPADDAFPDLKTMLDILAAAER